MDNTTNASHDLGNTGKDVSQDASKDVSKDVSQDASKDVSKDAGKDAGSTSASRGIPIWHEQLSPDLKGNKDLSQYQKISDLGKAYIELREKTKEMVRIPGENATPEELVAFNKAMNIPDSPDGYAIKRPEKMPEGMVYDETLEKKFKEIASKTKLSQKQAEEISAMFNQYNIDNYSDVDKIIKENKMFSENTLKNLWKGDSYNENRTKATKTFYETIKKLNPPGELGGADGIVKSFTESGFGDNPVMVWYFSKLFDSINVDRFGASSTPPVHTTQPGMLEFNMK